jgi:hypothetical protein
MTDSGDMQTNIASGPIGAPARRNAIFRILLYRRCVRAKSRNSRWLVCGSELNALLESYSGVHLSSFDTSDLRHPSLVHRQGTDAIRSTPPSSTGSKSRNVAYMNCELIRSVRRGPQLQ